MAPSMHSGTHPFPPLHPQPGTFQVCPHRLVNCAVFRRKQGVQNSLMYSFSKHIYMKGVCQEVTRGAGHSPGPSGGGSR